MPTFEKRNAGMIDKLSINVLQPIVKADRQVKNNNNFFFRANGTLILVMIELVEKLNELNLNLSLSKSVYISDKVFANRMRLKMIALSVFADLGPNDCSFSTLCPVKVRVLGITISANLSPRFDIVKLRKQLRTTQLAVGS
ncbi:hypothetical protein GJ496_003629 [Pomphorhynchus laevis]|nr:hypothetical protein GJ496_003629 [Pomphorhynchus laevis]